MFSKRRGPKAVYGRAKTSKQSDLLWEEAITASPIKVFNTKVVYSSISTDVSSLASNVKSEMSPDDYLEPQPQVLQSASSSTLNIAPTPCLNGTEMTTKEAFLRKSDSAETPAHNITEKQESHPTTTPIKTAALLSPLIASTPIDSTFLNSCQPPSHIRFDSSTSTAEEDTDSVSSISSSDLSSIESLDPLGQLTDAFQNLTATGQSTYIDESSVAAEKDLQDVQTLLSLCDQLETDDFHEHINKISSVSRLRKLGEASFSEVYLGTAETDNEETVYKVIPFGEGADEVPIQDIIQEVRISTAMAAVPGYVKVRGMRIVQGRYPEVLMQAWDDWKLQHESESDRPDWYKASQRYCIIALENGGMDLEHYKIETWHEALQLLRKIVQTLALGEEKRQFEHRDLHWGNILVKRAQDEEESAITIIDYTLSRAQVSDQLSDVAYYGFTDRAIFEAEGEDYQFDIYRLMKSSITDGDSELDAKQEDWIQFHPATNALWLHYLVDKLLYAKDLKKPSLRTSKRCPTLDTTAIIAWRKLESLWKLLNPERKYKPNEAPIDSATRIAILMD